MNSYSESSIRTEKKNQNCRKLGGDSCNFEQANEKAGLNEAHCYCHTMRNIVKSEETHLNSRCHGTEGEKLWEYMRDFRFSQPRQHATTLES